MIKKFVFLILVIVAFKTRAQGEQPEPLQESIETQKEALRVVLASIKGGPQLVQELQNIQVQFTLVAQELGITRLFNRLRVVIQEECDFILTNQTIQNLISQSAIIGRQIQEYMKSSEFRDVQQLQKSLRIISQVPNPSAQERRQKEILQNQIKVLMIQKLGSLMEQARAINRQISQQLQSYTVQINLLSKRIRDIVQNNDRVIELRKRILDFKNNSTFRQVIAQLQPQLEQSLDTLNGSYEQKYSSEMPCIFMGSGNFVPSSNFFELINQGVIDLLIRS